MAEFPQATADALVPFLASLTESRPSTADTQG